MALTPRHCLDLASTTLVALIALSIGWELWLAPLRPGGSMLVLKVLPLLLPLFGILRGKLATYRWAVLLIWFYVAEGVTRMLTDPDGLSRWLAAGELILALGFFAAGACYLRGTRQPAGR